MAWIPFAIAAMPAIVDMMSPKDPLPGAPNPIALPNRDLYKRQILEGAFDPQSHLYNIARQGFMNDLNADLARKGVGFSSGANTAMSQGMAELANKFLEGEQARRLNAFNAVTGYDMGQAQQQGQQQQLAYQALMNAYNASQADKNKQMQTFQGLASAGANAYGGYQANQQADLNRTQQQANFERQMAVYESANRPSATGGYYSSAPGYFGNQGTMNVGTSGGYGGW